ncbi:MAG TPA: RodZ domain-containing protein [Bryobacteraceae bacterium]|nr:RodZ domain-containing protein [Bryobacteraceae bacterium]
MFSVGERLKRARQGRGLSLDAAAAETKISARYLQAIESDNRKALPSGFFYKSFVDQYAKWLALDTREIDAEIDRLLSADEPLPLPCFENVVARNVPPMKSTRHFPAFRSYASLVSLVLVVAACSSVYALWHAGRLNPKVFAEHVREWTKPAAVQAAPARKIEAPRVAEEHAAPIAPAAEPKPVKLEETAALTPAEHRVLLDLMAHEATWLSVSSDGKPVFSGTLQANETKSVSGKEFAKLRVGNAAGIEVRLNGRMLGTLGARGQVLTVVFTPDNFEIVPPAPKESD